jgi:hypothetical protein
MKQSFILSFLPLKNIPSKTQKWKTPVHVWIREMYQKRQKKALRKKVSKKDAQIHGEGQ